MVPHFAYRVSELLYSPTLFVITVFRVQLPLLLETSREQLENFTGFAPDFVIEDYSAIILKKLNLLDLICLANFLQLESNGTAEELRNNILLSLADLSTFHTKLNTRGVKECPPRDAEDSFAFSPLSTDRKSADASISQNDLS
ncbi:hypothetical protein TNIN_216421 [Trichonephila inaurata madagascariensis]|uniref:Uncharacterized protein n=1 Tax=Trichonephila inaurata madagascariensis TaxID=2747483 RepID=A0A8X6YC75_9ARAC|nr:hypothetical protein TNIN_216421 [Trichonephila inaurata madagascariensis]